MTGNKYATPDPEIHLLGTLIATKRAAETARKALGEAIRVPTEKLVPSLWRAWQAADDAQRNVLREIRRSSGCVVVPMVRRIK